MNSLGTVPAGVLPKPTITRRIVVEISILRSSHKSKGTPTGIDVVCETPDGKPHIAWIGSRGFKTGPLPQEVLWKAIGLGPKDKLEIVSRAGQTGFFPWPKIEMDSHNPENNSGPAACKPFDGEPKEEWAYRIILNRGTHEQLTLDPVIIIEQ